MACFFGSWLRALQKKQNSGYNTRVLPIKQNRRRMLLAVCDINFKRENIALFVHGKGSVAILWLGQFVFHGAGTVLALLVLNLSRLWVSTNYKLGRDNCFFPNIYAQGGHSLKQSTTPVFSINDIFFLSLHLVKSVPKTLAKDAIICLPNLLHINNIN